MNSPSPQCISIVVPFHNEADAIDYFHAELRSALAKIEDLDFEIICVDDGSTDDTLARLIELTHRDHRFRVLELSRNFGKEAALSAGIDAAAGDAVIPMDADLQDPPELLAALIAKWRSGADVVLARRVERRSDSFFKRTSANLFYRIHNAISQIKIPDNVGDFRLMNRASVDALKQLPERNRFTKGLFAWVGFRTAIVDYVRPPRKEGKTKFSAWKLWNFALEGFASFSTAPLRLWSYLGGFGALVAAVYAAVIIGRTLIDGVDVPGYASLLVVVLFIGSLQLIGIGVMGEYIGRIYLETKQRPRYLIRNTYLGGEPAAFERAGEGQEANIPSPRRAMALAPRAFAGASGTPRLHPQRSGPATESLHPAQRGIGIALLAAAVIVVAAFGYNHWMLDPRSYFYADDWQWLHRAEFSTWSLDYFSILPTAPYNDRPLGFAFIKAVYAMAGLNHRGIQIALLSLHAINCVLLYLIAARCISRGGALLAALLAAMWFSANVAVGWMAAIFDLLGGTFCLSTVLLRQVALRSGNRLRYDLAGALCYLLAIRTKEFALGLIAVLIVMNIVVERRSVRATLRELAPYLAVFAIYAACYARLLWTAGPAIGNPYHLEFSFEGVFSSLALYLKSLFFVESGFPWAVMLALVAAVGAGMIAAKEKIQRVALFGLAGFVVMLGPTLLLPRHVDPLYLYTPHFFMALAVGCLATRRVVPTFVALAAAITIVAAPTVTRLRQNTVNFYRIKGEVSQAQFNAAVKLLTPLPAGATVFISGVEYFFNPFFSVPPGDSLQLAFKDPGLTVQMDKPDAELVREYCATAGPRRFLRFAGPQASNATGDVERSCKAPDPAFPSSAPTHAARGA